MLRMEAEGMVKSFPLILEDMPLLNHEIVHFCLLGNKIAIVQFAFGYRIQEEDDRERKTPSYVLLDMFSLDFREHKQAVLSYVEEEIFLASDAVCYYENNEFLLNTKRNMNSMPSIAKIIQISDTSLIEIGEAPPAIKATYNDQKNYVFGEYEVFMVSSFIMGCREFATKKILWKLKLSAYLYTQVEEQRGMLYFGTAGKGGRFYGVKIVTGEVMFHLNTGGTVNFTRYKDHLLIANKLRKPMLINSQDGTEVKKIEFGHFKLTFDQHMLVVQDTFYAIAIHKEAMFAVCVDLL